MITKNIAKRLLLFTALLVSPLAASGQTVRTCVSYADPSKLDRLQQALENEGVPYRIQVFPDGNAVCVASQYRTKLIATEGKLFPPLKRPPPGVEIPQSPNHIPLSAVKLISPKQQHALEAELTKRGIWFTKDKNGAIWYECTHEKEVQAIEFWVVDHVKAR